MEVYLDRSIFGNNNHEIPLTELPVNRSFLWEGQELFIPAVYVGQSGAVLDVCAKISVDEMTAFLKKWDKKRRLSLKTQEDYEQIDADNPGSKNFAVTMHLDDMPLTHYMSSSLNWYPETVFRAGNESDIPAQKEEWENDKTAEKLMEAYSLSRECCWHFTRLSYNWRGETILSPKNVSLNFLANLIPVTSGYFTTISDASAHMESEADTKALPCQFLTTNSYSSSCMEPEVDMKAPQCQSFGTAVPCNGQTVKTFHPVTGQEYTLTLQKCLQMRHSFAGIENQDVIYPEHCQTLYYRISPDISRDLFDIRDCAESDKPIANKSRENPCQSACATAVFMSEKHTIPECRTTVSSMHFEPAAEVRWRMVFQIKPKADMEISFPVQA